MASFFNVGRRVALWSAGAGMAVPLLVPAVMADDGSAPEKPCCSAAKIRPSQLPIYDEPEDLYNIEYHMAGKGQLEEGIGVVRKEVTEAVAATKEFRDQLSHYYQTGKAHTAGSVEYLLDEENLAARYGTIAAGGLLGLLLGARKKGGFFKKIIYTSAGAGATAAALHPQYTKQFSEALVNDAGTYATVAYNFVAGVKPQDGTEAEEKKAAPSPVKTRESEKEGASKDAPAVGGGEGEQKDVVVKVTGKQDGPDTAGADYGQSNPADSDMYTTRS